MTGKELIKQEIERLKHNTPNAYDLSRFMLLEEIESFINSLPEEPASEDLAEYYKKEFLPKEWFAKPGQRTVSEFNFFTAKHFAEWQKRQMMKDAVEDCSVIFLSDNKNWLQIPGANLVKALESFKQGEKVKLIIVKTEQ